MGMAVSFLLLLKTSDFKERMTEVCMSVCVRLPMRSVMWEGLGFFFNLKSSDFEDSRMEVHMCRHTFCFL